jgi:pilus assembly protein CpaB
VSARRILVALVLALMVSGLCTWLASRRLAKTVPASSIPVAMYAAPSRAMQAGEVLKANNTELVAWPGSIPMDGAFLRIADVLDRELLFPLAKGQPILDRDLSAPGSGVGLASRIPNGKRAVALRSDEVVGVAGLLVPGSHLDVLVTYRPEQSNESLTATVLQNVVVLAAGHQMEPDPNGKVSDVTIVTLLLTPEESQRAVLASAQGAIHFVLRNGADSALANSGPTQLSQLGDVAVAPRHSVRPMATAAAVAAPTPKPHGIEMVFGDGMSDARSAAPQGGGAGR